MNGPQHDDDVLTRLERHIAECIANDSASEADTEAALLGILGNATGPAAPDYSGYVGAPVIRRRHERNKRRQLQPKMREAKPSNREPESALRKAFRDLIERLRSFSDADSQTALDELVELQRISEIDIQRIAHALTNAIASMPDETMNEQTALVRAMHKYLHSFPEISRAASLPVEETFTSVILSEAQSLRDARNDAENQAAHGAAHTAVTRTKLGLRETRTIPPLAF